MKSAFQEKRPKIPELLREIRDALRAVLLKQPAQPAAPIVSVAAPIVHPPAVSVRVAQPPKCGFTCEVTAYRPDGRIKTFTITPN